MNRKHPSGVFMMEMIAVVFFFIVCAAICIKTFVKADFMSRGAAELNQGVLIAQSVAEVWKGEGTAGLEKRFQAKEQELGTDSYAMGLDRAGNPCEKEMAVYEVRVENTGTGQADVVVSRNGKGIYSLTVKKHETQHGRR
ncbi:hypothetical protein Closa_1303 [[Clostridium] saccharolyticum WM1]|uniref:Type II secretion system protein n=2 Tax=Lacrimispora TaxID=2719231 RepID=D9R8F4_LACSW|nr:hypothetical protein [Lacrimispora saccharolytica]ADL03906.1 hypothetical protein Closa_1303 [[Clostridium] saccharolyticum WM1]QRV22090.1 hypothetical protein I6K70_10265 [Lacrimispora saccharolytica]